jgi:hypothetical protein
MRGPVPIEGSVMFRGSGRELRRERTMYIGGGAVVLIVVIVLIVVLMRRG